MVDTILIVDDDPAIREIFTIYLEMGGYRILTATGGMECLDLLKVQKPDLILMDMMMEPMDGWETLLAIRSCPVTSSVPVIIITGKQPTSKEILQYGGLIEDFIVKPVDFKKIAASFHLIIEKYRILIREIDRIKKEEQDPELLSEYSCLLRLVRVVNNLKKRSGDYLWTDSIPLKKQEERLLWLHKKLGFPDSLLQRDEGG
jgi:DNA-binding response OmpR family regulator